MSQGGKALIFQGLAQACVRERPPRVRAKMPSEREREQIAPRPVGLVEVGDVRRIHQR